MFISRIKTTNFGAARDNEVRLVDGLVVVRAPNGAGKSSLFYQAPMYAFFGTSTLDGTLDDTVTEGEKPSSLLVELDYGPYTWKRSKSSASVVGNGLQISGQAEVTSFSEQLFGVSKDSAEMVLVSKQGETSGLVKKKSAAINQFIEEAANFQQLEDIIERAKTLYPSGNVELFEQQIADNNLSIASLEESEKSLRSECSEISEKYGELEKKYNSRVIERDRDEAAFKLVEAEFNQVVDHNNKVTKLKANLEKELANRDVIKARLEESKAKRLAIPAFNQSELDEASEYINSYQSLKELWSEYSTFLGVKLEEPYWDGTEVEFEAELADTVKAKSNLTDAVNDLKSDIKVQNSRISNTSVCASCGSDISEKVGKINAEANLEIARLTANLSAKSKELAAVSETLASLKDIKSRHVKRDYNRITWDKNTVPFSAKWDGAVPIEPSSEDYSKKVALLQSYRDSLKDISSNETRTKELNELLTSADDRVKDVESEVAALGGSKGIVEIELRKEEVAKILSVSSGEVTELLNGELFYSNEHVRVQTELKNCEERRAELALAVKSIEEKIATDKSNSQFLKILRDTKPKVLQKVWSNILTLIEAPFQEMTEKDMKIDRNSKGFTAGGRSTSRLSGSEASVLGLCFRSALRDLFAPGAGFTIYDEPFADCSKERTAVGIGALMQISGQRVLITHDEQTELSADQVVEL